MIQIQGGAVTLEDFDVLAQAHPYRVKGIFYSEMFLFVRACLQAGVTLVIESGVLHGMSTAILAAVKLWPVISIDRSESALAGAPPEGVRFVRGEAETALPWLLAVNSSIYSKNRIGVLIDGPKGDSARALKDYCLTFPAVKVVAIHNPERGFGEGLHSHDSQWADTRVLDRFVPAEFRDRYPDGPGLVLWLA